MAAYHLFIVRQTSMPDCTKAQGLADWIFWSQTDPSALAAAVQCVLSSPHPRNNERMNAW